MFLRSSGGGFLSIAGFSVSPAGEVAFALVGGGGFVFSEGIFAASCTFGGGVAVLSGGDFCGSLWA